MAWSLVARSWFWTSLPPSFPPGGRRRRAGSTGCQMTSLSSATTAQASSQPCGGDITAESVGRFSAASVAAALSLESIWDAAAVSGFAASALATSRTTRRKQLQAAPVRMKVQREQDRQVVLFHGLDVVKALMMSHKCRMLPHPYLSKCPERLQQPCTVEELWKIRVKILLFLVLLHRRLSS